MDADNQPVSDESIDIDNPEFQTVWQLIQFTNNSIFMTGRAGSGKSTFLKYITSHTRKRHIVLAPTGIAAVNVGGVTIHSFFKLPFKPLLPSDPDFAGTERLRKRLAYNKAKIKLIREVELIVIDEVSMVRADIIDFIDRILRTYTGNFRQPFGGKQMLFVGDVLQLEPVVTNDMKAIMREYYPQTYFFAANVFREVAIVPIELQKVYRQNDRHFLDILDRVRMGTVSQADLDVINRCYSIEECDEIEHSDRLVMTLATRRDTVDSINESHLARLTTPEVRYIGRVVDDFPDNSLPVPKELTLKVGAQVVFTRNDPEHRWVNGSLGRITETKGDYVEVELENGNRHCVEPFVWENIVYDYNEKDKSIKENVVGTYTQLPVNLAWALTIHKSQGLTFNEVIIDARGAFSGGQTYVALSRCRSLEGLHLRSKVGMRDIFVSSAVINFCRTFNDRTLVERALELARADKAYFEAAEAFDTGKYSEAVDRFIEGLKLRNELKRDSSVRLIKRKLARFADTDSQIRRLESEIAGYRRQFEKLADEYVTMGRLCIDDGMDPTAAIANFDKALTLVPDFLPAKVAKIVVLMMFNDMSEALSLLSTINMAHCNERDVIAVALELSRHDMAFEAIDMLLALDERSEESPEIYKALAEVYDKAGDTATGRRYRLKATHLSKHKRKSK